MYNLKDYFLKHRLAFLMSQSVQRPEIKIPTLFYVFWSTYFHCVSSKIYGKNYSFFRQIYRGGGWPCPSVLLQHSTTFLLMNVKRWILWMCPICAWHSKSILYSFGKRIYDTPSLDRMWVKYEQHRSQSLGRSPSPCNKTSFGGGGGKGGGGKRFFWFHTLFACWVLLAPATAAPFWQPQHCTPQAGGRL